jgi:hypothetical protein
MKRLHLGSRDPEEKVFDGAILSLAIPRPKMTCSSSSLGLGRFPVGDQVRLILLDLDVLRTSLLSKASPEVVCPRWGVTECPDEAALLKENIDDGRGRRKVLESEKRRVSRGTSPKGEEAVPWPILAFRLSTVSLLALAVCNDRPGDLEVRFEGASVLAIHANIDCGRVVEFCEGRRLAPILSAEEDRAGAKEDSPIGDLASEDDGDVRYMNGRLNSGFILDVSRIGT